MSFSTLIWFLVIISLSLLSAIALASKQLKRIYRVNAEDAEDTRIIQHIIFGIALADVFWATILIIYYATEDSPSVRLWPALHLSISRASLGTWTTVLFMGSCIWEFVLTVFVVMKVRAYSTSLSHTLLRRSSVLALNEQQSTPLPTYCGICAMSNPKMLHLSIWGITLLYGIVLQSLVFTDSSFNNRNRWDTHWIQVVLVVALKLTTPVLLYLYITRDPSIHCENVGQAIRKRLLRSFAVFTFAWTGMTVITLVCEYRNEHVVTSAVVVTFASFYYLLPFARSIVYGLDQATVYRVIRNYLPPTYVEDRGLSLTQSGHFHTLMSYSNYISDSTTMEAIKERPVFVYTDIEGSTTLWQTDPPAMQKALELHDEMFRQFLLKYHGYEISTEGDAFRLAFSNVEDALCWCLETQKGLVGLNWPNGILSLPPAQIICGPSGETILQGLRVRMGVFQGGSDLVQREHPVTHKITFHGPSEQYTQDLSDQAKGGQILITEEIYQAWRKSKVSTSMFSEAHIHKAGSFSLDKAQKKIIEIYSVVPRKYFGRQCFFL